MYNLQMSGLGKSEGGVFNEVRLEGVQRLYGNVQCLDFFSEGILKATAIECQNSFNLEGVGGMSSLKAPNINTEGACRVKEAVIGQALHAEGYLSTGGVVKVETAQIVGKVKFKEAVEATKINLSFCAASSFDVISATEVKISRYLDSDYYQMSKGSGIFKRRRKYKMKGQLIEGETVEIEYCHVNAIYGDHIKIGPNCQINEVAYKESLEIHPNAVVKTVKQV